MNRYGRLALERTRGDRPRAFGELEDPEAFFAGIGQEMADRIPGLRDEILGPQRDGEDQYEYHLRGLQAHRVAEELVVYDHWIMLAPAEDDDGDPIEAWLNRPDDWLDDEDDDGGDGNELAGQLGLSVRRSGGGI